ncbi:MAG: hypothetical protein QOJ22_833, partial [Thermoleophilaceae bacterium]|nr:hypothetical protein [Thermoleophilaceae bacterium]
GIPDWVAGLAFVVVTVLAVFLAFGGQLPWKQEYELKAVVTSGLELQSRSPRSPSACSSASRRTSRSPRGTR